MPAATASAADHPAGHPVVHRLHVRVYWEDTDAGGVVYYANYLKFFERARTEWLRESGIAQQVLHDEAGILFVVAEAQVSFREPARLDDLLDIDVMVAQTGRASLVLLQQACRSGRLLAAGRIRIGCVDAPTLRPRRIPQPLLDRLERPR
jgi:acyl-CoA thioester hydrolase